MTLTVTPTQLDVATGTLFSLSQEVTYGPNPLASLQSLRQPQGEHLLLESAEINSRAHLKSLLLIDPSLRLVCRGQQVVITALTLNGQSILHWLATQFPPSVNVTQMTATVATAEQANMQLVLEFPAPAEPNATLCEQTRLLALSNLEPLRQLQKLTTNSSHPFALFLAGVFAYDLIASMENLPAVAEGANQCPDYHYYLAETLLVIDHQQRRSELIASLPTGPQFKQRQAALQLRMQQLQQQLQETANPTPSPKTPAASAPMAHSQDIQVTPAAEPFLAQVKQLKQAIADGEFCQIVLSRRFQLPCQNALASYYALKQHNPSPYMFYLQTQDFELFGASPESALKYTAATNQLELYPIAGTRKRAQAATTAQQIEQDLRLELELRLDQKEQAEHLMLVDLARSDLTRVAIPGSRHLANLLKVDRYSHVMHLVSHVVAQLQAPFDALHAYRACMNMGTLVGAPKLNAARTIRHLEQERRGSYGGAVGYLTGQGDMDTCIVIRSAYVAQGVATVQAGAGIVADSCPVAELKETEQKAQAVLTAIQQANQQGASYVS